MAPYETLFRTFKTKEPSWFCLKLLWFPTEPVGILSLQNVQFSTLRRYALLPKLLSQVDKQITLIQVVFYGGLNDVKKVYPVKQCSCYHFCIYIPLFQSMSRAEDLKPSHNIYDKQTIPSLSEISIIAQTNRIVSCYDYIRHFCLTGRFVVALWHYKWDGKWCVECNTKLLFL